MIKTFADRDTAALFANHRARRFDGEWRQAARRKLSLLHRAASLEDLRIPPGNRLEKLGGDRAGQYSLRINDQWRLCFTWQDGDAWDVEILDYH
jgi:proteic killer suppression protein